MIKTNTIITSVKKYFFDKFGASAESAKHKLQSCMDAYREHFLESESGKLILMDLMRFADMDKINYNNSFTPQTLAFNEGRRAVIHYILEMADLTEIELLSKKGKE